MTNAVAGPWAAGKGAYFYQGGRVGYNRRRQSRNTRSILMAEVTKTQALPAPFIETLGKTFGEQLGRLAPQAIDTTQFQPTLATPGGVGGTGVGQRAQQAAATSSRLRSLTVWHFGRSYRRRCKAQELESLSTLFIRRCRIRTDGCRINGNRSRNWSRIDLLLMKVLILRVLLIQLKLRCNKSLHRQTNMRNAQAVGAGAFGGARQGIEQAIAGQQYNQNLGAMTAGLQQQGFQQAQQARQQDYQNQLGLGQQQLGLGQYQQGMEGQRIQGMAQLGQTDIGYRQAMADTLAKQNQLSAYEPYQRTGFMGEQLAGLMGGYPGGSRMQISPTASPMQQGISTGLGALMGYAGFKNLMGQ